MKRDITWIDWTPDFYFGGSDSLADYYIDDLKKIDGFKQAFYWYWSGTYEGAGQLLVQIKDKWYLNDLSHCSCYGPLSHMSLITGYKDMNDMKAHLTDAYLDEVEVLIKAVEDKNHQERVTHGSYA